MEKFANVINVWILGTLFSATVSDEGTAMWLKEAAWAPCQKTLPSSLLP